MKSASIRRSVSISVRIASNLNKGRNDIFFVRPSISICLGSDRFQTKIEDWLMGGEPVFLRFGYKGDGFLGKTYNLFSSNFLALGLGGKKKEALCWFVQGRDRSGVSRK
jgi:hypothetical protein